MWLLQQERAETLQCDAYISLEAGKPDCPRLHPTACKRSNCKVHAFAFTGVFATSTRHLVTPKEMSFSSPNIPFSHQHCPWCQDFDELLGLPFLYCEVFTSPFPILLTHQWVKMNSWVILGTISWSKESWHLSGCCLDPSRGRLNWHLEGVANKGRTWKLGWVPDGTGQPLTTKSCGIQFPLGGPLHLPIIHSSQVPR